MTGRSVRRTPGSNALLREAGDTWDARLACQLIAGAPLRSRTAERTKEQQLRRLLAGQGSGNAPSMNTARVEWDLTARAGVRKRHCEPSPHSVGSTSAQLSVDAC